MYELNKLIKKIENAVEIEHYTTYERIAQKADMNIATLWKIRQGKQGTTLKTAQKIINALHELKKSK